jgi:hypothetical protein
MDDELLMDISDFEGDTNINDLNNFDDLKQTVQEGKLRESIQRSKEHEQEFLIEKNK